MFNTCYGVAFGAAASWSFGNDFATNVLIFGADISSSSYTDNYKNSFLVLGKGPTDGIIGEVVTFCINFSKPKTKFCLSFHYNGDSSYSFVNE